MSELVNAVRCGAVRCGAMRCDAMRCDAMRCGAMRCDAVRRRGKEGSECPYLLDEFLQELAPNFRYCTYQ